MRIGLAGAAGSFSEMAAMTYAKEAGDAAPTYEYLTHPSNVLDALDAGTIDIGIFAIENSTGGVVTEYLPAIAEHKFSIDKIFEIPVDHMLLVKKGTNASDVTMIVSQRQALRQCRMYLARQWPSVEVKEYVDTATAGKDLSEGVLPATAAVVASARAGELYGLEALDQKIQDLKFNYTVFIAAKPMSK
ncbi:MAG: prephenate dehydratase domain-containing protein [Patescibacteria group bacterium]